MSFDSKEEHEAWLKERDSYDKDFKQPTIELEVHLGESDYWQIQRGQRGRIYKMQNRLLLLRLEPYWIVKYYLEGELELAAYYLTQEAALFEMDRIMEFGKHDERMVCHCGRCNAMFDAGSVANLCPMCGADHNGKDFKEYSGWSIWNLKPADYAASMYLEWKDHLKWRKQNGTLPKWFDEDLM